MKKFNRITRTAAASIALTTAFAALPAKAETNEPIMVLAQAQTTSRWKPDQSAPQSPQLDRTKAALEQTLLKIAENQYVEKLQSVHQKFKTYKWRTVYSVGEVPKEPTGFRLAMVADPAMSQLGAESFYAEEKIPTADGFPAMNCPVAILGGPPGRTIVLNPHRPRDRVEITDAMLQGALIRAFPDKGAQMWRVASSLRNNMCIAMYNTAQLSYRFKRYEALQANLERCQKEGIMVTGWRVKEGLDFPGGVHRTLQFGGGLMWKCGAVYKGNLEDAFTYDTWLKWSDSNPVTLNLWKQLLGVDDSPTNCPTSCVDVIQGGGVSAAICIGASPDKSAIGDTVPLKLGVQVEAFNRTRHVCTPTIKVPAPFGLAESFNEMADNAKQDAMKKMQQQLMELFPINSEMMNQLVTLTTLMR